VLVDSHCHLDRLDLSAFEGEFGAFVDAAESEHIDHMLCVCIDLEHYPGMLGLVENIDNVSVSVGVHPNERDVREPSVAELLELAKHPKNVAIGETGLDYYYGEGDLEWQRERFRRHIRAARAASKPLIIHTRDAREDTIAIMKEENAAEAGGVMHCFTESWDMAQAALDLGFYISFSGILTFRNAQALRDVAKKVPEDRLLIETDSPYLAPVPHRGKPNLPLYVRYVAQQLADLRGSSLTQIADVTGENFYRLFRHAA